MAASTEPRFSLELFMLLPTELQDTILGFLDQRSVVALGCTSHNGRNMIVSHLNANLRTTVVKILCVLGKLELLPELTLQEESRGLSFLAPYRDAIAQIDQKRGFGENNFEKYSAAYRVIESFIYNNQELVAKEVALYNGDSGLLAVTSQLCSKCGFLGSAHQIASRLVEDSHGVQALSTLSYSALSYRYRDAGDLKNAERFAFCIPLETHQGSSLSQIVRIHLTNRKWDEVYRITALIKSDTPYSLLCSEIIKNCETREELIQFEKFVESQNCSLDVKEHVYYSLYCGYYRVNAVEDAKRLINENPGLDL